MDRLIIFFYIVTICCKSTLALDMVIPITDIDAAKLYYSGREVVNIDTCENICSNYYQVNVQVYPVYSKSQYCFCSTKKTINHRNGDLIEMVSPTMLPCSSFIEECFIKDELDSLSVIYNKDFSINIPNNIITPTEIAFSAFFVNTPLTLGTSGNIPYTSAQIKAALAEIEYTTKLAPILESLNTMEKEVKTITVIQPGYVKFCVKGYKGLEKTFLTHLSANISNPHLDIPKALNAKIEKPLLFFLDGGTNVSIKLDVETMSNKLSYEFKADVNVLSVGNKVSKAISNAAKDIDLDAGQNIVYVIPETSFLESGIISFLEINVKTKGVLTLFIVRPNCTEGDSYSVGKQSCGKEDPLKDVSLANDVAVTETSLVEGVIKRTAVISVEETGYQLLRLDSLHIQVKRGDMIGVKADTMQVVLKSDSSSQQRVYRMIAETTPGTVVALNVVTGVAPSIRVYYALPFIFKFDPPNLNDYGIVNYTATVTNSLGSLQVRKSLYIEKSITGLQFKDGSPKNISTGSYDLNLPNDRFIRFAAELDPLPNVNLSINIPGLNKTEYLKKGSLYTTMELKDFGIGNFEIILIASNLVSTQNVSTVISIMSRIKNTDITASKTVVKQNEEFQLYIKIDSGTNIKLDIDYGNGFTNSSFIEHAEGGIFYNVTYKYTECQLYKVVATVDNAVTLVVKKDEIEITCVCAIQNLTVETTPLRSSNGKVVISKTDELWLKTRLLKGSFVTYNISWGDGQFEIVDQTTKAIPELFQKSHQYNFLGSYTLNVTAASEGATLLWSCDVLVQGCAPPPLFFIYGTEDQPLNITRERQQKFLASWVYTTPKCRVEIEPSFKAIKWTLTGLDNVYNKVTDQIDQVDQTVSYTIPRMTLQLGSYKLELEMYYEDLKTFSTYTAYFYVKESKLEAFISNGEYQEIPMFVLQLNNEEEHYDFELSGSESKDPAGNSEFLKYKWQCRVNSTALEIKLAKVNVTKNITDHLLCLSDSFVDVPANQMSLKNMHLNTVLFLPNISYVFQLNISKDTRRAGFTQNVKFIQGAPPMITCKCINNCKPKINVMEQMKYRYSCKLCPTNLIVHGEWKMIKIKDGVETTENVSDIFMTQPWSPNLVIRANSLEEGVSYRLELTAYYKSRPTIKASIRLQRMTAVVPKGGECSARPKVGLAMANIFSIKCQNWENADGPTRYEFRYSVFAEPTVKISTTNGAEMKLINSDLDTPFLQNISLPAGREDTNYTVNINVRIINSYNSYYIYDKINITVYPLGFNESESSNNALNSILNQKPKKPTDAQSVSTYVESSMSVIKYQAKGDKVLEEVKINKLTMLPDENDLLMKEEKLLILSDKRTKITEKNIKYLQEVKIISIQDLVTASGALAATTQNTEFLSDTAEKGATELVKMFAEDFYKFLEETDTEYLQRSMMETFNVIASLMKKKKERTTQLNQYATEANIQSMTTGKPTRASTSTMTPTEKFNAKINDSKIDTDILVYTTALLFDTLGKTMLIDEKKMKTETGAFNASVCKAMPSSLTNASLKNDEGFGFQLKDLKLSKSSPLIVQSATFSDNLYSWDLNSSFGIKSTLETLVLKNLAGKECKVSNLTNPISIKIKNNVEELIKENVSLHMPGLSYTKAVEITEGCNLLVSIDKANDPSGLTNLTVYIQYGKRGSQNDHDVMIKIMNTGEFIIEESEIPALVNKTLNVTRNTNVRSVGDNSVVMWNFNEFTRADYINLTTNGNMSRQSNITVIPKLYFTFVYTGPMPDLVITENLYNYDKIESQGAWNYSFRAFCSACSYWDVDSNSWQKDGCEIDLNETSLTTTACLCTHLTAFGGFFVAPNPLPPLSFALLKEGYVLLVAVAIILLFWVVGLIIMRRIDKSDVTKIGVCPLIDNKLEDTYLYEITINTGSRRYAGTESNVFFTMTGDQHHSGVRVLKDTQRTTFQRASSDVFIMTTAQPLGELSYVRIWHDNSAGGWYLRSIEVIDLQTEEKFLFIATRWLAVDKLDGMVDCLLPVAGDKELTDFNYLFTNKSRRDFSDAHIWFSIYARPPRSSFTRCQRLSVAVSLLFCSMTASVMYYDAIPTGDIATENRIGSFKFTWRQVYVAIISACITVPVNLLLVGLFRSLRPTTPETTSGEDESVSTGSSSSHELNIKPSPTQQNLLKNQQRNDRLDVPDQYSDMEDVEKLKKNKKKKPFYLPHWFIYPTWILCVLTIFGCGFLIVLYGMAFGNAKSLDWLASVTICLVQDVFIMQPFKVFAMALFIALIVRKLEDEEKSEVEKRARYLAKDESWLHKVKDETTIFDRVETEELKPPDLSKLDWMRELRLKEVQMYAITREMLLYVFFTAVVFLIGFLSRDQSAYYQTRDIEELLRLRVRNPELNKPLQFSSILSSADFWPWMDKLFLAEVFPNKWYNLDPWYDDYPEIRDFPGNIFLNDLNSKIVNGIRIRQVRVKPNSCDMAKEVVDFMTIDCAAEYGVAEEESGNYKGDWDIPYFNESLPKLSSTNKPWIYQTWQQLDGYPFWAELDTYFGGGYVVEIFPRWQNKDILDSLKETNWIDRHSRAVIIEFTIFNAATYYFNAVTIVIEFPPGGGAIPYFQVTTFQLYRYAQHSMVFGIATEILFLLFMVVFTIRETRLLYRTGWSYFTEFWNLVEISNIILTCVAVGFYVYREIYGRSLMARLPSKKPEDFINFQFAALWDSFFTYVIALICFFVTLKFIKLLRFNRRISLLSHTLKRAWFPLSMFGICFGIVIIAVVFSSSIIFGSNLYGYRDYLKTTASIISLLLGKFSYYQFESTNRILGPIFFFAFNVMVNWIIMNMLISILTDVFAEVQAELLAQSNDYEIVDFVIGHFKEWLGMSKSQKKADREWERRSFLDEKKSAKATRQSLIRKFRQNRDDENDDIFGFEKSVHWRDTNEKQPKYLLEEDLNEEDINKTVNKFIECFNILYFDDQLVANQMNNLVKTEISKTSVC